MDTKVEALKKVAVALGCAETVAEVQGETIVEVLNFIAENYNAPTSA